MTLSASHVISDYYPIFPNLFVYFYESNLLSKEVYSLPFSKELGDPADSEGRQALLSRSVQTCFGRFRYERCQRVFWIF